MPGLDARSAEKNPIFKNGGHDGVADGGLNRRRYVFRTPLRSIMNPISVQLFHIVFHIGKLGVDHELPRIYIYFADRKIGFIYFSGLKRQARKINFTNRFLIDASEETPARCFTSPAHSFPSERRRPLSCFGSAIYSLGLGPGGCVAHTFLSEWIYPRTSPTD